MGVNIGNGISAIIDTIPDEHVQDRVVGMIYRALAHGVVPNLDEESDDVRVVAALCFREAERIAARAARNARYWASAKGVIRPAEPGDASCKTSCKMSSKTQDSEHPELEESITKVEVITTAPSCKTSCKTQREKERNERESFPPHPLYKEKENKERERPTPDGAGNEAKTWVETSFDTFWAEYPRKVSKHDAKKAFVALFNSTPGGKCHSLLGDMLTAVRRFCRSHDWQKDNGKYIPYPATWIRARRWEDEGMTTVEIHDVGSAVAARLVKGLTI